MTKLSDTNASDEVVKPKKEFLGYIHSFRGLVILLVIVSHVWLNWPEDSSIGVIIKVLFVNNSVMFVFIAGFLFQFLSKKFEYKTYLLRKAQNVILPYLIISIPILFYRLGLPEYGEAILTEYPNFADYNVFLKVFLYLVYGAHMIQLWFIPMIVLFYLIAPIFMYIDKNPRLYGYVLIFLFIVSVLVDRQELTNIPRMFVHFLFPYVFGMFASHYRERFLFFLNTYWKQLLTLILIVGVLNYIYDDEYYEKFNFVFKVLLCSFLIFLIKKFETKVPAFFAKIAELSFGMYFIHYYFILLIRVGYLKVMGTEVPANLLSWVIYAVTTIVLTIVTLQVVKLITGKKSRYLVGC